MSPAVSVIIPTYNRAAMVVEAVESVLAQDMEDFELIVVDDGSTDDTAEKLSIYDNRLRYYHQENAGVSSARNRGVEYSTAPYIGFLDSDDLWLPPKLRRQYTYMKENPDIYICQTEEIWWRNGRRMNPRKHHQKMAGNIFRQSLALCLVSPSAVMMRRDLLQTVGYFDETLPVAEDYDLWLRISAAYPVSLLPEPLVIKRGGHPDQLSAARGIDRYRIKALEKLLRSGTLSVQQHEWVWQTLQRKCEIYAQGCLKRGKVEEGRHYLALPEMYWQELKEPEFRSQEPESK